MSGAGPGGGALRRPPAPTSPTYRAQPPTPRRAIYGEVKELFGGTKPIVDRFADDDNDPWVDVMRTLDSPEPGVTSFATLGMSRFENGGLELDGKPPRVELLAACQSNFPRMADGLASCALNVARDGWQVTPRVVHPNGLNMYVPGAGPRAARLHSLPPPHTRA